MATKSGVKLAGLKSSRSSGMGAAHKAPKKFKNTSTKGGIKLVKSKKAAHMG